MPPVSIFKRTSKRSKIDSEPFQPGPQYWQLVFHESALFTTEKNIAYAFTQHESFASVSLGETFARELFIRLSHRERIHIAIQCELSYWGQHLVFQINLIEDAYHQHIHQLAVNGYILDPVWAAWLPHSTLYTPFKFACHRIKAVVYYGGNTLGT